MAHARRELANAIRALAMDAVQRAQSGHPGAPMGMADIAEVLWNDYLRHNPANPAWPNRDRFVLSNGHGSMLQYALLHLTGYDLTIDDLKAFRQLHSRTPGHPERGYTPGVETTTGPLGQGLANAVGMALAEQLLAARFNRPGYDLVDHHTYVFLGDGCLMEGISHEVCSLAGTLGLGKLIGVYDDNGISIDGAVAGWFTDDTPQRFEAYGWHVIPDVDGHDPDAIRRAFEAAHAETNRPTLICARTTIAYGAPNASGTKEAHGAALGEAEVRAAREALGWPHEPFHIPAAIYEDWDARRAGAAAEADWQQRFDAYRGEYPELAAEFERRGRGELPPSFRDEAAAVIADAQGEGTEVATRKASQMALEAFGARVPELVGGSADLTGSNNTWWSGCQIVSPQAADGNYVFYGVREFGMTAIMSGMAAHGGVVPYGGTFLVFSDYARNAVRMAALMGLRSILVYSHDSIGLGEDGPTHQAVEHLAALRLIPNLEVWRPCDVPETMVAWQVALTRPDGPTALALSRQKTAHEARDAKQLALIEHGGYVLHEPEGEPRVILMATGSEVELAMQAARHLEADGYGARVVSMPCLERFSAQDAAYRESVLPASITARVAVEAALPDPWYPFVGLDGAVVGMHGYGESAPGGDCYAHFGITANAVTEAARHLL
jgi:transketolase